MVGPDLRGFARSLSIDAYGAVHDVVVRYVLGRLLKPLHGFKDYAPWLKLFKEVLGAERFLLVILDGARYDLFKVVYPKYLRGVLRKAVVPPPHTYGWLPEAFSTPEFNRLRIFYASLGIASHDIRIKDFVPKGRDVEVYAVRPGRLKGVGAVLPSEINRVVREEGLSGRDIVWYAQPHFPWICDRELSSKLAREVLVHDFVPPDTVRRKLRALRVPRSHVVKAYMCNLALALKGVCGLLDIARGLGVKHGRIVVASDHGEMLGEYGLYMHQEYDLPQLTIVPWLEVEP